MKIKHLLILSPGFPENEDDYLCIPPLQSYLKVLQNQYNNLKISVVAFNYPAGERLYQWNGIDVFTPMGNNEKFPKNWLVRWKIWKYISALHQQHPISFIHSFWLGECAFIGDLLSRKYRIPHLTTLMGQDAKASNKWLKYPFHAKHIKVCLSATQRASLPFRQEVKIIPWGVDLADFPALNQGVRNIDILGVGSLIPLKKYDLFIKIIAHVKDIIPSLKVCLIGDGPEKEKLIQLTNDLSLQTTIIFKGLLPRKEVLAYMNQSKVFLHTSTYESQGYVFNEALAMGAQIVSAEVGIARESAHWAIAYTLESFVQKIITFLTDKDRDRAKLAIEMKDTVHQYVKQYN